MSQTITIVKVDHMLWSTRKETADLGVLFETGFKAKVNGGEVAEFIPANVTAKTSKGDLVRALKTNKKEKVGHKAWVAVKYGETVELEILEG